MSTDRAAYTAGLRALADLLDVHDEVPLPYHGGEDCPMSLHVLYGGTIEEQRDRFLAIVRTLPGRKDKGVRGDDYYDVKTQLAGLHIKVTTYRDTVCERVVTGTREVIREIADPEALAAVPKTTVTETVEDVEWVCAPLTAPVAVTA